MSENVVATQVRPRAIQRDWGRALCEPPHSQSARTEGCCEVEVTMQAYDELVERLAQLHRVSARDKGAATRMRPGERSSPGTETWHRLRSPAQDTPPADAQPLLPPFRHWPLSPLVRRLSKTALGLGIVAVLSFAPLQSSRPWSQGTHKVRAAECGERSCSCC
jgi:hypothetical protein